MKNKCKYVFTLTIAVMILFYRGDSVVAMAAEQNIASAAGAEPEQSAEPAAEQEPEQSTEPAAEPESEQVTEPAAEPVPEQIMEPAVEPEAGQSIKTVSESAPDSVSTGEALVEWLEAHKNTGGVVRLADHVSLDGEYSYCPGGMNMPAVVVDTAQYTITVTGGIEFLSDHHLTFSGQPEGKSIFYVAEKGMLSMMGITVESGQCALWQAEGAGLSVSDCHISGSIHYADTPFVVDHSYSSVCVVLEKGQVLDDVLPTSIRGDINRQGQVSYEPVPVTWNLEGTEKQQKQRRRFQLSGFFVQAASAEPVVCTVVYNDYPLTFTEVRASVTDSMYLFMGWYTKPEVSLPVTVVSEYSFDGADWFADEEKLVSNDDDFFSIAFPAEQCGVEAHSNIYIRLRCDDNGTEYFSNVLRYAADHLDYAEDIGGSRGGGTSIMNPPALPQENDPAQQSIGGSSPAAEQPVQNADQNTGSGDAGAEPWTSSDANQTKNDSTDAAKTGGGQPSSAGQPLYAESSNVSTEQQLYAESKASIARRSSHAESRSDNGVINVDNPDGKECINRNAAATSEKREGGKNIMLATGVVLLSVIAGIVGFYIQSRKQLAG